MMTVLEGQVLMGQQVVFPGTQCALNFNRGRRGRGHYREWGWYGARFWVAGGLAQSSDRYCSVLK